jgi:hypothetical protein
MSVQYPQNDYTRMIEATRSANASGVRGIGVASASPLPTAQSADLGRVVEEQARPELTPAERAELDAQARAAGIMDERIGTAPEGTASAYSSQEDAVAAGAPVVRTPRAVVTPTGRVVTSALVPPIVAPRLPNFRKVEGIDLLRDRVLIDGMEFPISAEDARGFKEFVVETARAAIMEKLNEAVGLFASPETAEDPNGGSTPEGTSTEVQREPEGSSTEPSV